MDGVRELLALFVWVLHSGNIYGDRMGTVVSKLDM